MKASLLHTPGSVDNLDYQEIEKPTINEVEVLIKVKAISINPVDVKSREGKGMFGILKDYHPLILGWDVAGIVEESKTDEFVIGDKVFGMVNFPGH